MSVWQRLVYFVIMKNMMVHFIWSEQVRYQPYGTQNPENIQELMVLLKHKRGILQWIESN